MTSVVRIHHLPPNKTDTKRYLFFCCGGFESRLLTKRHRLLTKRRWRFVTGVPFPQESESITSHLHRTSPTALFQKIPKFLDKIRPRFASRLPFPQKSEYTASHLHRTFPASLFQPIPKFLDKKRPLLVSHPLYSFRIAKKTQENILLRLLSI